LESKELGWNRAENWFFMFSLRGLKRREKRRWIVRVRENLLK
jgi:hypothetical protein